MGGLGGRLGIKSWEIGIRASVGIKGWGIGMWGTSGGVYFLSWGIWHMVKSHHFVAMLPFGKTRSRGRPFGTPRKTVLKS